MKSSKCVDMTHKMSLKVECYLYAIILIVTNSGLCHLDINICRLGHLLKRLMLSFFLGEQSPNEIRLRFGLAKVKILERSWLQLRKTQMVVAVLWSSTCRTCCSTHKSTTQTYTTFLSSLAWH